MIQGINKFKLGSALLIGATLTMAGCGGSSSSAPNAGTTTTTAANLVGQVFSQSTSFVEMKDEQGETIKDEEGRVRVKSTTTQSGLSGCNVSVYDLTGSTVLATGTGSSTGTFTVTSGNLTAGKSYKVVTVCGSKSFTAIIGADLTPASSKTPSSVNAQSTLITVEIVKAIVAAVNSATANLPASAVAQVLNALLTPATLNQISGAITATIQNAISSGTMQTPTDATSTGMANAVATATTVAAVGSAETAYTSGSVNGVSNTIPVSVGNAVTGAASAAAAFPGCNSSLAGQLDNSGNPVASVNLCIQAVAKMMFSVIHFDVGILKSGGAFGSVSSCPNSTLTAAFPNAKFIDGSSASSGFSPTDALFCVAHNTTVQVNRNQSYSNGGGGGGGGALFTEAGSTVPAGVLTAIGTALYNGTNYHLSDLDKLVYTYSSSTGGMNARLISTSNTYNFPSPSMGNYNFNSQTYTLLTASNGATQASNSPLSGGVWPSTCNSSPCNPSNGSTFGFTDVTWGSAASNFNLATAIGNSTWAGSAFLGSFGGTIPSLAQVQTQFVNATVHSDNNRTGNSQFFVLYTEQPNFNDPNCNYSSTGPINQPYVVPQTGVTTTVCAGVDGALTPYVTVNVVTAAPAATSDALHPGTSLISQINNGGTTGQYYLYPSQNGGTFTGLFQFINASNGYILTDELLNQRFVQVILNSSQCSSLSIADAGCTVGKIYNATGSYNNCGNSCPTVVVDSEQGATGAAISGTYTLTPATQPNQIYNPAVAGPSVIGVGTGNNQSAWQQLVITGVSTANGRLTGVTALSQTASLTAGQYNVVPQYNCPPPGQAGTCVQNGYYLSGVSGAPFTSLSAVTALDNGVTNGVDSLLSYFPSTQAPNGVTNAVRYTDNYFRNATYGSSFFPNGAGGQGNWATVATNPLVFMGPANNPSYNCSLDPFFDDNTGPTAQQGDGILHFTTDAFGNVTCSKVTFNQGYNVGSYIHGNTMQIPNIPAHTGAKIVLNSSNSYKYSDPQSITSLLNTAFGAWLDGSHSLGASTNLNSLQGFALIFMMLNNTGNSPSNINGIMSNNNNFMIASPVLNGGAAQTLNTAIGLGFANYHQ